MLKKKNKKISAFIFSEDPHNILIGNGEITCRLCNKRGEGVARGRCVERWGKLEY